MIWTYLVFAVIGAATMLIGVLVGYAITTKTEKDKK